MPLLANKTALVTGASRGLGLAISKELASLGASVIMLARNSDLLSQNLSNLPIRNASQEHHTITCDLRDLSSIPNAISQPFVKNTSILINCAGISQNSLLLRTSPQAIEDLITTNLTAPIILTRHMTKHLISNHPANVVNISSVLGLKGTRGTSVYAATKAGLVGFTKSLAMELGPKKVRCNCISPGLVTETDMGKGLVYETAMGVEGVPVRDVVRAVLGVLQNESVTGHNLVVDRGFLC